MAKEITMPKLSDTMEEGKVLRWLKREGDPVERGDVIAEIETDKADMEMEAFDSGVLLAITVKAGESAAVGDVIGYVGRAGETLEAVESRSGEARRVSAVGTSARGASGTPAEAELEEEAGLAEVEEEMPLVEENAEIAGAHADIADVIGHEADEEAEGEEGSARQAPAGRPWQAGGGAAAPTKGMNDRLPVREARAERLRRPKVSPVARKLAAEVGVDLAELEGSGPDGRIVRRDVEGALRGRQRAAVPTPAAEAAPPAPPGAEPAVQPLPVPVARGELGVVLPHSKIRRAVARRMAESKRTVPHFYTTVAVRMDEALRLKEALALRDPDSGVSVSHLIVKAAALALERFPRVNGAFEEEGIRIPAEVNVGLAVAVEDGLIVPVIRDCARKPLGQIAREARELVGRVRSGRLGQNDLQGATFSVSNMGMFQIEQFAAIVVPPQSAILAVGGTADEPVVRDGQVVPGKVMRMTLSADHRVIDGVLAAAFLVEVKRFLESPLSLVF